MPPRRSQRGCGPSSSRAVRSPQPGLAALPRGPAGARAALPAGRSASSAAQSSGGLEAATRTPSSRGQSRQPPSGQAPPSGRHLGCTSLRTSVGSPPHLGCTSPPSLVRRRRHRRHGGRRHVCAALAADAPLQTPPRPSSPLCASSPPQPRLHPPRLLRPSPQLRPGSLRNHALRDGEPARQARCVGSLASRPTQGRGQHSSAPPAPSPARRLAAYRVGGKDRPPLSPLHTRVRFPHGAVTRDLRGRAAPLARREIPARSRLDLGSISARSRVGGRPPRAAHRVAARPSRGDTNLPRC